MSKQYFEQDEDGKFVKVGWEFTGFPTDGIWYVKDGKQNCIERIQDAKEVAPDLRYDYLGMADDLANFLTDETKGKVSMYELAKTACEFFAKKGEDQRGKEIFEF
jgi:hypothetical protein